MLFFVGTAEDIASVPVSTVFGGGQKQRKPAIFGDAEMLSLLSGREGKDRFSLEKLLSRVREGI